MTLIQIYDRIIIANCGDSRAIAIYRNGNSYHLKQLTVDHKPDLPDEKRRIERLGGTVANPYNDKSPSRVYLNGQNYPGLAMSRSIGDFVGGSVGVICKPGKKFI